MSTRGDAHISSTADMPVSSPTYAHSSDCAPYALPGVGAHLFLGDRRLARLLRLALVVLVADLDPDEFILAARC